jgi:hypothetical protein
LENQPSSQASPQGRRILVAIVTGEAGERIQQWRTVYDPEQARRLPPHTTLCYWAPSVEPEALERQVRHAFEKAAAVHLGSVREFGNDEETFYVELMDTSTLDAARARLYDGAHLALPGRHEWTWHVTCVRDSRNRDKDELRRAAADLWLDVEWTVDTVGYLELRGKQYEPIAVWNV